MKTTITTPFTIMIACLSVGGLISTDIFLPALGEMSKFYHVPETQVQNAISIFLLGVSFSQLVYGPLSDSLGRKNVLIVGILIWLFSTAGVIYTSSINELLLLRLLQGIGSCAGITIGRAIINDLLDKKTAGKLYLVIFPFVGMSPAIAPMIGGMLSHYIDWQACFVFMVGFILFTLGLTIFTLKESHPPEKRHHLSFKNATVSTMYVLGNKQFLFYAAIPCFAYAAYFAYIVESPFLLSRLGLPQAWLGYTYILLSVSYVAGNLTAKKVSGIDGIDYALRKGYYIFTIGGLLFVLQMFISPQPIISSIISISVLTFGNGFLLPLGTASAIAAHPKGAGTASGVMGALQLGSASLSSFMIGKVSGHTPGVTALSIALICITGFVIYIFCQSESIDYTANKESK